MWLRSRWRGWSAEQVLHEFRAGDATGDQQVSPGAGHVEQVAFAGHQLIEVAVVGDGLDVLGWRRQGRTKEALEAEQHLGDHHPGIAVAEDVVGGEAVVAFQTQLQPGVHIPHQIGEGCAVEGE